MTSRFVCFHCHQLSYNISINININVSFYLSRCVGRGFLFPFFSFFPFFFFCLLLDLLLEDEDEDEDDDDDVLDLLDFFFFFLSSELWSLESGDLVLDFFMFLLLLSSFSIMSVLESSEDDLEKKNVQFIHSIRDTYMLLFQEGVNLSEQ